MPVEQFLSTLRIENKDKLDDLGLKNTKIARLAVRVRFVELPNFGKLIRVQPQVIFEE